jgi:hypothetical protein
VIDLIEPPNWFADIWLAVAPRNIRSDFPAYVLWWMLEVGVVGWLIWVAI